MDLKTWTPFPYLDTEWRIDLSRIIRESYAFRPFAPDRHETKRGSDASSRRSFR